MTTAKNPTIRALEVALATATKALETNMMTTNKALEIAMATAVTKFETQIATVNDEVNRHKKWIYGNGSAGADKDIAVMAVKLCNIEKKLNQILGAVLTLVVSVAGSVIVWLITK